MAGRDKLLDPEYRNFIKANLCLWITKKGLETFAYEKSKQFHQQVFDSLNQLNITNTGTPICKVLYIKQNTLRVVCQDSFCTNFVNEVIRLAKPFTIQKYNLANSDYKLWHSNPWELSKIFMHPGQPPSQKGPKDTDLSGLLNFLLHCPTANSGVSSVQKIIEVRNVRNHLMHSGTVDIITLQSMEHVLVTLLKDAKELANRPESLEAVKKITEIMKHDFQLENLSEEVGKHERELKKLENKSTQVENTTADLKTELEAKTVQIEEKVDLLERDHSKKKQLLTGIPPEISRMDSQSIEIYKKALEDGSEKDHSVRLMVVGPYDVGKTALTKRLLQEDVDIDERESTDGIDIHVGRCKVSLETKEWKIEPISKVAEDFTAQRIAKVLQRPEENLNRSLGRNTGETFENRFADKMRTDDDISKGNSELPETLVDKGERGPFDRSPSGRNTGEEQAKVEENNIHLEQIKEVVAASERPVSDNASVSVWDFGGQSVFYSTHQMFLSHRAIYILVNDMSKMIEDIKMADQPHFDCKETKSLKIEDYLDIWLYSIHGQSKGSQGVPPIILVGTKADKLESVDRTKKMDRFFKAIRNRFADKPLIRSHFINKNFGLSNVRIDPNLEDLRTAIIEQAEKQSYWGKELPAKWIPLEKVLYDLRKNKVQIISLEEFEKLNQKLAAPITRDDELQLFLEFHHDIGNIMYFKVPELKGKIVLSPQFLVNALKSLFTAEEFLENDPVINWREFAGQGKLTTSLLDAVWNKGENKEFQENREHILALMERLNIIAKPVAEDGKSPENSATQGDGFYFVPCMLKECPLEATLLNKSEYISTSWLCLKLKRRAFPGAIFNRLLAGCISKWTLARTGPKYHIYRGCGQFVLDEEDQHTLTMSFLCNIIALSVTKYGEKNKYPDVNICQGVYSIVQEILKGIGKCLSIDIEFDEYIQCPYGPNFEGRCLHSVQKLKKTNEFPCRMHDKPRMIHSSDLLKYWFDSKEVADQIPTEKQLGRIAHRIGKEFEALAIELGISQARIDQIKIEYPGRAVDQTRRILLEWKTKMANLATFRELERAMEVVKINSQDVFRAI